MSLDPKNYMTWNAFQDHPIFGHDKSNIEAWSHDPDRYGDLNYYGRFWPEHYVHIDPAPPLDYQKQIAERDIANLRLVCQQIESAFGRIRYELVVIDDFTAYVWISCPRFFIQVYPCFPDKELVLKLYIDRPDIGVAEYDCESVSILVERLSQLFGQERTN